MKKYYHEFLVSTEKVAGYPCISKVWIPLDGIWTVNQWANYQLVIRSGQYLGIILHDYNDAWEGSR